MDVIATALGEFIWTSSCALVNFCLSSGLSALLVFISFLAAILASAFYKYAIRGEETPLGGIMDLPSEDDVPIDDQEDILNDRISSTEEDWEQEIQTS